MIGVLLATSVVFSGCRLEKSKDEMTDKINSVIICEKAEMDIAAVFYLKNYDEKTEVDRIRDIKESLYTIFSLPKKTKLQRQIHENGHDFQKVQIRIDKNQYFDSYALVADDSVLGVHFEQEHIKELMRGEKILIRYYDGEKAQTKELDISDLKNYY